MEKKYIPYKSPYEVADFYVAVDGCDDWSGKLESPTKDGADGPFATIEKARDAIRIAKNGANRTLYVLVRGGEYRLSKPVKFSSSDSLNKAHKVIYAAYPNETPVVSSDVDITGWKLCKSDIPEHLLGKLYEAPIPTLPNNKKIFYTLYENGKLLTRAKSKSSTVTTEGRTTDGYNSANEVARQDLNSFDFQPDAIKNWDNLSDIEIVAIPVGYVTNYLSLESVDEEPVLPKQV